MRTKQEVINFLESKVGTKVPCKGTPSLDGQCVTLIKSLMEFIGVPDPYKARGHAKTAISAYLSEGIADKGAGFLSVFSNKNMGGGYGHIWCNAGEGNGVFYESNGQKPLIVTKGKTYSYDSVCNFDKWIKEESMTDNSMTIEKSVFESLVTKATKLDELEKNGYVLKKDYDERVDGLNQTVTQLTSSVKLQSSIVMDLQKQLATKPKEVIKEVIKEVPVTVVKEVIKEVPKIVEVIKEVPKEVIKVVTVDSPKIELGGLQLVTLALKAMIAGKW